MPSTITKINSEAFRLSTKLAALDLPATLATIETQAIYQCNGLTSLTSRNTTPPTINGSNGIPSSCQIYVPLSAVDTYKSAAWWTNYSARINAIP